MPVGAVGCSTAGWSPPVWPDALHDQRVSTAQTTAGPKTFCIAAPPSLLQPGNGYLRIELSETEGLALTCRTRKSIECEVELEHVDALLAENAQSTILGHFRNENPHLLLRQVARLCDARHLEFGGGGRDVGIETAPRRGDEIDRDRRRRIFCLELFGVVLHAVDQCLARRPEVGAGGVVGCIGDRDRLSRIVRVGFSGRRGTRMKI